MATKKAKKKPLTSKGKKIYAKLKDSAKRFTKLGFPFPEVVQTVLCVTLTFNGKSSTLPDTMKAVRLCEALFPGHYITRAQRTVKIYFEEVQPKKRLPLKSKKRLGTKPKGGIIKKLSRGGGYMRKAA